MNTTIRQFAVSGSAAVALLGGAAAITVADTSTASATEMQTAVDRATGAPVNMPDGRTVHIRGLDTAAYKADASHYTAAVTLASANSDDDPAGVTTGVTPDGGTGSALQNPTQQTPAGYNQQIQTQASGGAIATGIVSLLILAIIVYVKVKHSGLKAGDAVIGALLGIALSGTVIGTMGSQLTNSLVGSLGTMLGGLG